MEAATGAPMNQAQVFRIATIEIEVVDDVIRWTAYTEAGRARRHEPGGDEPLNLTDQKRSAIDLLAKLLQHHSDLDKDDRISDDLYKKLLSVVGQELFG